MTADEVEECWQLLRQSLHSVSYETLAHLPTYSQWLAKQDWTKSYRRHRKNLQLIGLNDAEKRWVLKNPSHLFALDALFKTYPDALVVQCHRPVETIMASMCSLAQHTTEGWSNSFTGEVIGDDALDDLTDRAPADAQQPRDRRLGHLLRQPRDDVLEVARVMRPRPRPRHRLQPDTAVAATQQPQLALDHAAAGAEIEVPPALDTATMDLQPAGLTALGADAPAPPQAHGHDHPLRAERDVRHAGAGQAQQALECGGDAHVALPCEPLAIRQPAACCEGGGASLGFCATSAKFATPLESASSARETRPFRPALHPQDERRPRFTRASG
jgi:hypothetical protein